MAAQKYVKDLEQEVELEEARDLLNRGLRKMALFGVALLVNVTSIVPFLAGQPLHRYFYTIGRPLLLLSMGLLTLFGLSVCQVYFFWIDVRSLRKSQGKRAG